jgi:DNA primase
MPPGENFLAQLKSVVDPMMVFGHYLSLKKTGNRYRALCPFHNEKTPSFYASENGMFHCFGCGVGGDVIKFVMLMEKMDFKDCIRVLSARYGIPLKYESSSERQEKEQLFDLMRQAADFFHNLLTGHSSGTEALAYLEQRGITRDTIKRFQLGWAPSAWNTLVEHFHKKDVDPALLEKCGLVIARQQEGYYDRYRSRIIVPIHDIHGNIIGLGGRIFQGTGEEAKYLNSPETPLYSKSHHLFGLYISKEHIQEKNAALLVEGYFDMILPFQAGHTNIVASLGTSLTEGQARLLRRYTDRIILFYDPDTAGKTAVMRALPILLKESFTVSVALLPQGLDPDSYVRERGAEALQQEIDKAVRYDQFFLQTVAQNNDLKTPTGKLSASEEMISLLSAIGNPFELDRVIKVFAASIDATPQMLRDQFSRGKKSRVGSSGLGKNSSRVLSNAERDLLRVLLINPKNAHEAITGFGTDLLDELSRPEIFRQITGLIADNPEITTAELIHLCEAADQDFLSSLILSDTALEPPEDWLERLLHERNDRTLRKLDSEIKEAIANSDEEKLDQLLDRKTKLGQQVIREMKTRKI